MNSLCSAVSCTHLSKPPVVAAPPPQFKTLAEFNFINYIVSILPELRERVRREAAAVKEEDTPFGPTPLLPFRPDPCALC